MQLAGLLMRQSVDDWVTPQTASLTAIHASPSHMPKGTLLKVLILHNVTSVVVSLKISLNA